MPPDLSAPIGLATPAAVRAGLAEQLLPPPDISITEACERERFLYNPGGGYTGPYRRSMAPYCVAPQDSLRDRLYSTTVFVAPGQCGKTEILLNWATHSVLFDPADMLLVLDEKDQAEDFIDRRIKRWIQYNDGVGRRMVDDKRYFRSFIGMTLAVLWATGSKAASKPAPRIAIDERDSMPDDLDGEGDPVELFAKRAATFGDAAQLYVSSSPKKPIRRGITGERKLGEHEAPPTTGILALYNQGTRKRYYWPCPECGEFHTPTFEMLRWPDGVTASDRDYPVQLECPHCGCLLDEVHKPAMLAAAHWVSEGQTIDCDGRIHGPARAASIDSYWLRGPSNAFTGWNQLVGKFLAGHAELDDTGADAKLKTFWQLEEAYPYEAPEGEHDINLDADALKARAEPYPLGIVPAQSRFLTAQVDVQGNRFEVEIRAWGVGLESWVVQRFAIFKAKDPSAPEGERLLDPATQKGDWDLLFDRVLNSAWPIEGTALAARIACTAVDAFGSDGVTTQAYDFWRRAKSRGFGKWRLMLTKGGTRENAPLLAWSQPELSGGKSRKTGGYAWLATLNVAALKDVAAKRLKLENPGPQFCHLAEALGDLPGIDYWAELTAEAKVDGKWERRRPRNEAWDHLVQAIGVSLHLRANRIDWAAPQPWARPWTEKNANAVPLPERAQAAGSDDGPQAAGAPVPIPTPVPARPRQRVVRSNFMARR